ncbi:hypothetical protein A2872_00525 [Candidatus Gottesmanbacteria bacterium RIFCSPHIGHO2_01_FULL_42_12]|uniref:Uncharacterized protein n=1 Tax=Candidatus Gottesmanbacteria bacterium RIFCSPHIGHO2_01_FULL_42_12 TaxID=1798377 RepID=A0A1F5Z3A8_9BACT|nr:MAG: hypothetical protein A2872_00525 [Candidatus Gottesmanbacteria bacterium RIFCSPHIGHO2_01_FULL_42_12]
MDALAERTEEGRLYRADIDGLLLNKLYPLVSEWRNPPRFTSWAIKRKYIALDRVPPELKHLSRGRKIK